MRKVLLLLTIAAFIANTFVVSAWACPGDLSAAKLHNMTSSKDKGSSATEAPCPSHLSSNVQQDESDKKTQDNNPSKHCGGICFCIHASAHQIPTLSDANNLKIDISHSNYIFLKGQSYKPCSIAPPYKPPKLVS